MTIDLPPVRMGVADPNGVLEVLVPLLVTSMFRQPEYLLRRPAYAPMRSDIAVLVQLDHEQRITDVAVQRGNVPGEWRTAVAAPLSAVYAPDDDLPTPRYTVRRWLPSAWSTAFVAAHLLPGVPYDDAHQIRVTAALYEPEGQP